MRRVCFGMFTEPCAKVDGLLVRVHATPNAKEPRVVQAEDGGFDVRVDEKAIGGRANKRLVEIMAEHLKVPKSSILIVSGAKSRDKVLRVG